MLTAFTIPTYQKLIQKRKIKDIAFQNKKHPKGIGEISDVFLIKICSDRLTNGGKWCIIYYAKANDNIIRICEWYKTPI